MKFLFREAVDEDARDIAVLSNQLGYLISQQATVENLESIRKKENEIVFVAVDEKEVVGWIHIFHTTRVESGSFCEIGGLVVNANYRRTGIGKTLVEKAKTWSMDKLVASLRVRTNVKRQEAHEFYIRLGFNESKEQKVFEIDLS
jgi:GNAT superfamily N-acetyltransferase